VSPLEFRDPAVALPQLYVLAVNQSHGALFRFILVFAKQVDAVEDVAVRPNDVRAILLHLGHRSWSSVAICRGTRVRSEPILVSRANYAAHLETAPVTNIANRFKRQTQEPWEERSTEMHELRQRGCRSRDEQRPRRGVLRELLAEGLRLIRCPSLRSAHVY